MPTAMRRSTTAASQRQRAVADGRGVNAGKAGDEVLAGFFMLEFSTSSRILETVDSPNSLVVLIFSRPVMLTQPLMTSSPSDVAGQALAGEGGGVQGGAPSTMTPSMGTRSPGCTTMTVPTSTSSGSTCSSLPSSPSMLA